MAGFGNELAQAVRSLRQSPLASGITVAALALGIGANGAIFSAINGVLLKPLPYTQPDRLIHIWAREPNGDPRWTASEADFRAWREGATSFEDMAAFNVAFSVISGDAESERVTGAVVTPNFFRLLGVQPALGPGFTDEHGQPGRENVAILSDRLWQRRYGADPGIVGSEIRVSDRAYTVVGVMPAEFRHPEAAVRESADLFRPIAFSGDAPSRSRQYRILGRLRADAPLERADAEVAAIARSMAEQLPDSHRDWGVTLVPLKEQLYGESRAGLLLLFAASAVMLLIVCTNVANLMLARSLGRTREFAVRAALGSGSARLVRQVMLESLVLGVAGAAVGIAVVALAGDVLAAASRRYVSPLADIDLDVNVFLFSTLVAAGTALLFGLAPALRAGRADLRELLGEATRGSSAGRGSRRARHGLIMAEVALTAALLVSATLLLRSFATLVAVDKGFRDEGVLTFEVNLPAARYNDRASVTLLFDQLLDRLRETPGVRAASIVSSLPFTSENRFIYYLREGDPPPAGRLPWVEFEAVAPDYFLTLGIPLVSGRDLSALDARQDAEHVVVNRAFADQLWPGEDPLGRRILLAASSGAMEDAVAVTVVGVAGNILDDGLDAGVEPRVYRPHHRAGSRGMAVLVATDGEPAALAPAVRAELAALDRTIPITNLAPLPVVVGETLVVRRAVLTIAALFAGLALFAAALGIYGVVAYTVGERRREMGIRAALGATPGQVRRLVLGDAVRMVGFGLAAGFAISLVATRSLSALLFGVKAWDPLSFGLVAALLFAVAAVASLRPAHRAMRVDPMTVLRQE